MYFITRFKGSARGVAILLAIPLLVAAATPARALDDRDARVERAWQRWIEASRHETHTYSGDVIQDARIGALLGPNDGTTEIKIFDLNVGASGSAAGCASLDLVAELSTALERFPKEFLNFAEQTVAGLVSASPMIALAYFKPTWANYIKHMRNMINQSIIFRANQCGALNALIDKRLQDVEAAEIKKCIDLKIAEGMSGHDAQDACLKEPPGFSLLPKMLNPKTGKYEFRPVEYGLTNLFKEQGMSEKDANDYAQIITGYFGDLVFSSEGEGGGTKGRRNPDLQEGLTVLTQEKVKKWRERARTVAESAASNGGMPSDESLEAFRTPHTRISSEQFSYIYNQLGSTTAENLLAALADVNARMETLYQVVGIVEKYLEVAAAQPATSSKDKIKVFADNLARAARLHLGTIPGLEARYRDLLEKALKDAASSPIRDENSAITMTTLDGAKSVTP